VRNGVLFCIIDGKQTVRHLADGDACAGGHGE
jgi:hypothetical protein